MKNKQNELDFKFFEEKAGVISEDKCWVCICEGYLYTANSQEKLIEVLNEEWKHDKHLVG